MRYLLTALLTIALVAPFAWSRINTLPSDGESGSSTPAVEIHSADFATRSVNVATHVGDCLAWGKGTSAGVCDGVGTSDVSNMVMFHGQAEILSFGCQVYQDMSSDPGGDWPAGDDITFAVAEISGGTKRVIAGADILVDGTTSTAQQQDHIATIPGGGISTTSTGGGLLGIHVKSVNDAVAPGGTIAMSCRVTWSES